VARNLYLKIPPTLSLYLRVALSAVAIFESDCLVLRRISSQRIYSRQISEEEMEMEGATHTYNSLQNCIAILIIRTAPSD